MNTNETENKARARYLRRGIYSNPDNTRKVYLNDLAHKLTPSIGYYILSIVAGILCGFAFRFNSLALLILTLAVLPFIGPFFGISLAAATGSFGFLGKSLMHYLLAAGLFFLSALGVGGFSRYSSLLTGEMIGYFNQTRPLMIVTILCSAFFAGVAIVKGAERPQALSAGVMSGVLLPLGLAGFCIGLQYLDPVLNCIWTALIYGLLALAATLLAFLFTRVFVPKFGTFLLAGFILVGGLLYLLDYTQAINLDLSQRLSPVTQRLNTLLNPPTSTPTPEPSATATATITQTATATNTPTATDEATPTQTSTATVTASPTVTQTATPTIPKPTDTVTVTPSLTPTKYMTPTRTIRPSRTPTQTFTPAPTIVYGIVSVSNDVGLLIRTSPYISSDYLRSQFNGSMVEILGEQVENDGILWVKVRTNEGLEGWASAVALKTPVPSTIQP